MRKRVIAILILAGSFALGAQNASANFLYYNADNGRATFGNTVEAPGLYSSGSVGIGIQPATNKLYVYESNAANFDVAEFKGAGIASRVLISNPNQTWKLVTGSQNEFRIDGDNVSTFYIEDAAPADALRIMSNGNIGIGTGLSTGQKLDVSGTIRAQNANNSPGIIIKSTTALSANSANLQFTDNQTAPQNVYLRKNNASLILIGTDGLTTRAQIGADASTFTYFNGGNVGINTTNPTSKLTVDGDIKVLTAGNGIIFPDSSKLTSAFNTGVGSVSNTDTSLTISPTTGAVIASLNLGKANTWTGAQTFNTNAATFNAGANFPSGGLWNTTGVDVSGSVVTRGASAQVTIFDRQGLNTSFTLSSPVAGEFRINDQTGNNRLSINSTGDLGIGTTNPGAKLEVAGQVKITGGLPGLNKVLISDAGGLASWQTVSTLPAGAINGETLRYNGTNWVTNSNLFNDNTNVAIGGTISPGATLTLSETNATLANIQQTTSSNSLQIEGTCSDATCSTGVYLPGLIWNTANNNINRPKAGIWAYADSAGSDLYFGTSNNSLTGITNTAMVIDQGGNVGIGNTSPAQKLDVTGTIRAQNANNSPGIIIKSTTALSANSANLQFTDNQTAPQNVYLRKNNASLILIGTDGLTTRAQIGADASTFTYFNGGNVGIGNTTPASKLDITGDVRWSGILQAGSVPWARLTTFPTACPAGQVVTAVGTTLTCAADQGITVETDPQVGTLVANDVPRWNGSALTTGVIADDGTNVGIGTASVQEKLQVAGDVKVVSDSDVNTTLGSGAIYTQNTLGTIGLHIGTNEIQTVGDALYIQNDSAQPTHINNSVHVLANGNVGIGISPTQKLDVSGTVKATGLQVSTIPAPAVGNVLTAIDTSGNAAWQAAPGGLGGSGTAGKLPKFTGTGITVGDSVITESLGNIGIGEPAPLSRLEVKGSGNTSGTFGLEIKNSDGFYILGTRDDGTIGLGLAQPQYRVHVLGRPSITDYVNILPGAAGAIRLGVGLSNPANPLGVAGAASIGATYAASAAPANGLIVEGNVGIATLSTGSALDLNGALSVRGIAAPANAPAGQGRIYYDSTANKFKVSQNAAAYVDLVGSGGGVGPGTQNYVPKFNNAGGTTIGNSAIIDANGLVGVNTIFPGSALSVGGAGGASIGSAYALNPAPASGLLVEGDTGINTPSPQGRLHSRVTVSSKPAVFAEGVEDILAVYSYPYVSGTSIPVLAARDTGIVGINTAPTLPYALKVNGQVNVTNAATFAGATTITSTGEVGVKTSPTAPVALDVNGIAALRATTVATPGTTLTLPSPATSFIRINNGATAFSLNCIAANSVSGNKDGMVLMIYSLGTGNMTIINNNQGNPTCTSPASRILTVQGAGSLNLTTTGSGFVTLIFDATALPTPAWIVTSWNS